MRVLKAAKLVHGVHWSVVDCTLRHITNETATIVCGDQFSVPNEFQLIIPSDNSMQHARVVWRKDSQVGMELLGERGPAPKRGGVVVH